MTQVTEAMIDAGIAAMDDHGRLLNTATVTAIYLAMQSAQSTPPVEVKFPVRSPDEGGIVSSAGPLVQVGGEHSPGPNAEQHAALTPPPVAAEDELMSVRIQAEKEKVQQARNLLNSAIEGLVDAQVAAIAARDNGREAGVADEVRISREAFDFLMGEGPLEGTWFGELHNGLPGAFWWRGVLRAAARWPDRAALQHSTTPESGKGEKA